MDNQNLFSQSYSEIVRNVLGEGTQYFQMLGKSVSFNWPVAPIGQLSREAYQFMSASPNFSPIGIFGGVGTSTLFKNYKQIFGHVGFNESPEAQKQLKDLSNQVTELQNEITITWTNANTAYNTAKQNGGAVFAAKYPDIQTWLAGPGDVYTKEADGLQETVNGVLDQIATLNEAQMPTTLKEALDATKLPSGKPSDGNAPRGWTVVPNSAGNLEWQPVFNISATSRDWRQQLVDGSIGEKTIVLKADKSDSSIDKTWAGGNVGYGNPFWGVYAGGAWQRTNISESDKSVTATIKLKSSTVVNITPGEWFDGGFLKQLAISGNKGQGYNILSPYTATGGEHALFGKDGLCSTMVTGLVVAYKPSFSITMKSSTYKEYEQKIEAGGGFRIGPFSFGGSGGSYDQDIQTTGNTTVVTGGSTSDDPVIIGVTVGFPGVEKP